MSTLHKSGLAWHAVCMLAKHKIREDNEERHSQLDASCLKSDYKIIGLPRYSTCSQRWCSPPLSVNATVIVEPSL